MFYLPDMQEAFDFVAGDLGFIRRALTSKFGRLQPFERREPIWQLARSLIGSQTYDRVAEPALERLQRLWPESRDLAKADPAVVERVINPVNHAHDKAGRLVAALAQIARERGDHDLSFLKDWPVAQALAWLERLPGVGQKVAAATLNASKLKRPVFIVDSHVHRILLRFGFIGPRASARQGRDQVTAGMVDADGLLELFAQMKQLGQKVCRPFDAQCFACPLATRCRKQTHLGVPAPVARAPARAPFRRRAGFPAPAYRESGAGRARP